MTVQTMPWPPGTATLPSGRARPRTRWVPSVLGAVAAGMVPWVFVLGRTLPETTQVRHWPAVWIGLDLAMALGCATTARLYHRGDVRARLSASAVTALMGMDVWFDVLTARPGTEFTLALVCAVPELTLAGLCTWLALRDTERLS
jgi:hypothetical protein